MMQLKITKHRKGKKYGGEIFLLFNSHTLTYFEFVTMGMYSCITLVKSNQNILSYSDILIETLSIF